MSAQWYYRRDGQQFGPISSRKLYRLVRRGEIKADDMLWREGMPGWRAAGESKTLFGSEEGRQARVRGLRAVASTSRRRMPADTPTAAESDRLIDRRPLLTSIGIGAGAGTLISLVLAIVLVSVNSTVWEEDAAAPPPARPALETPAPEPAPETPAPETPDPETLEPEPLEPEPDPDTAPEPDPEPPDPDMLDIEALDPEPPAPIDPTSRLRKRRSSF